LGDLIPPVAAAATPAQELADALITVVRGKAVGGHRGDPSALLAAAGYLHGL